jgi:hypothetical protein
MHIYWIVYLVSLVSYASIMSFIAYKLLLNTSGFFYFFSIAFVLFVLIRSVQNSVFLQRANIIYEEKPEPVLLTLVPEK